MAPDDIAPRPVRDIVPSVCPHDCTSTCALEVERLDDRTIGRVRGSQRNTYTAGVICEKVARYGQRIHHPDRLLQPLRNPMVRAAYISEAARRLELDERQLVQHVGAANAEPGRRAGSPGK